MANVQEAQEQINWFRDNTATFSTDCSQPTGDDDQDNDGIVDALDICPNTPADETAGPTGCSLSQLADLAVRNVAISVGSDPCASEPNCSVDIAILKNIDMGLIIIKDGSEVIFDGRVSIINPLSLENLTEGQYEICASHPNIPGFEQCYTVTSTATANSIFTDIVIQNPGQVYVLKASGSKSYEVSVNGTTTTYDFDSIEEQELEIPLSVGRNAISVIGLLSCEDATNDLGTDDSVAETPELDTNNNMLLFPTVTKGKFTIANIQREEIASVLVTAFSGKSIALLGVHDNPEEIQLDISGNAQGVYLVTVTTMSGETELIKIILDR